VAAGLKFCFNNYNTQMGSASNRDMYFGFPLRNADCFTTMIRFCDTTLDALRGPTKYSFVKSIELATSSGNDITSLEMQMWGVK